MKSRPTPSTWMRFWIDRTEVTNARYVQFLNALGEYRGGCGGRDCVETRVEDADSHVLRQEFADVCRA